MVVEHSFVTTLESAEALRAGADLLRSRGFTAENQSAFRVDGSGLSDVELRRGRKSASRAKSSLELPQQVRMEFDRGRVTVAASLTPRMWMGRHYPPGALMTRSRKKPQPDQEELLVALAEALELHLSQLLPPDQSLAHLAALEARIADDARRRQRRHWIILGVILALVLGAIGLAIYDAARH